jgi:peptidoglycan/xylan/chitin deacetylase (PgdA/CDA1 family)
LYRATFGSVRKLVQGRISVRDLIRNWAAVSKLPFVYLGLAKDFWRDFDDSYLGLERDLPSTFFVIPFKNEPGQGPDGPAPRFRATRYAAQDLGGTIQKLIAAGREVGLHGIDAWLDSAKGRNEVQEIRRVTGTSEIGVRMHWLYQGQESAALLEEAGASYDSTIGYNETVGYRSGTTQVYKPLMAKRLLELPLHAMDTALFYPDHLGLSFRQAKKLLNQLRDNALRFGGCLTINWHDRSLAPERLWGECYATAVKDLTERNAWFSTARQAVSWFRRRRAAGFETDRNRPGGVRVRVAAKNDDALPGLRLRIHKARQLSAFGSYTSQDFEDSTFN